MHRQGRARAKGRSGLASQARAGHEPRDMARARQGQGKHRSTHEVPVSLP